MRTRTSRLDLLPLLTADWLICVSVSRMILKSDGIIPPPPAAPAPQPPAPSNQVEGKNPAICWSSWTDRHQNGAISPAGCDVRTSALLACC